METVMDWQPIQTAQLQYGPDVLLWNGVKVFPGWYADADADDGGWHDSRNQDKDDYPEHPQPTHWMPFPTPPEQP
jgi:hypothetical protein